MDFSESFVAVVRPHHLYEKAHGLVVTKARVVSGAPRTDNQPYLLENAKDGRKVTVDSEAEMWRTALSLCPNIIDILAAKCHVVDRALAVRGNLFLTYGASALVAMEEAVSARVALLHSTVIEALEATRITRAKVIPRRSRQSQNVSFLYVESKLNLPYDTEQHFMVLEAIPCPIQRDSWAMRVRLGTTTNEVIAENKKRLEKARQLLADKGLFIGDVVSGTCFADTV